MERSELFYLLVIPIILAGVLINARHLALPLPPNHLLGHRPASAPRSAGAGRRYHYFATMHLVHCIDDGQCLPLYRASLFSGSHRLQSSAGLSFKISREQQQRLAQTLDDLEHANRQLSLLYDRNISLRKTAEEATEAKTTTSTESVTRSARR